jgi:DNA phosphorothioation system restriction enzyme
MSLSDIDWEKLASSWIEQTSQELPLIENSYLKPSTWRVQESENTPYKVPGIPHLPPKLELRDYQTTAITNWFRHRGRGTLKMATGSGKTITALALARELYQKIGLQVLLIVCPYRHLVIQWQRECEKFNLQPLLAFETVHAWQSQMANHLYNIKAGTSCFLTIIVTNSTLISEGFQSQLVYFPEKTLIIGDEVHNLGSARLEESLPRNIGLRLGLSATPERYFDDPGTEAILNYFGAILKPELTLEDAIKRGALVHYLYYPILVELTEEEAVIYRKLTKRIGWAMQKNENWQNNPILTGLLMQRARLIGAAENKLSALHKLMSERLHTSHTLFYCGDGQVNNQRQLLAVTRLLGRELGYRVNTYTAETSLKEREELQEQFIRGDLQGLVAIRCLDEGVDIPSIETAVILASTGNPRQFIQRRGRVLRPSVGKKRANIFDMIVLPPELDRETWLIERQLLQKELKRFLEFSQIADNSDQAYQLIYEVLEKYDLLNM